MPKKQKCRYTQNICIFIVEFTEKVVCYCMRAKKQLHGGRSCYIIKTTNFVKDSPDMRKATKQEYVLEKIIADIESGRYGESGKMPTEAEYTERFRVSRQTIRSALARLEQEGVSSPVTGIEGRYKRPTTFGDTVSIQVRVEEFKGVRLTIHYFMTNLETEETVFEGTSQHCFVNHEGKPVILKKQVPAFAQLLQELVEAE